MSIIELLTSIWNYITEIPNNIKNFFQGISNSLSFLGDINTYLTNNINTFFSSFNNGTRALGDGTNILMLGLIGCITVGMVFILIDIVRDVL